MTSSVTRILRLLEFSDSAFPVGGFAFSNGIESAAAAGLVRDAATLERYTRDLVRQAAFTDGVAALHAHRAAATGDWEALIRTDRQAHRSKLNAETRQMSRRMGRKFAELACRIVDDALPGRLLEAIASKRTPGTWPAIQGAVFARCGLSEAELFGALCYGTANTALNAALRCLRVSHFDTQHILYRLSGAIPELYAEARDLELDEMHAFAPQIDILASLHEKGPQRMFMN